jgi:hypothetical protein
LDIYSVVFTKFAYQNKIFIQSNDNRNRQKHEIDLIKQKEKKYYAKLLTLEISSKNKYFFIFKNKFIKKTYQNNIYR